MPARPTVPTARDLRGGLRRRARRVRGQWLAIAQTTIAAAVAWGLASLVHPRPFFAPAAAVISLGVAGGRRTVRAIELTVGVAVGIAIADLVVRALGTSTLVLGLVVALAMSGALLVGGGTLLVNQAAISAILVVATLQPGSSPSPTRFVDALIGGGVALIIGQVLLPRDPVRAMARAAQPVVADLALALRETGKGLREGDIDRAGNALQTARATDDDLAAFFDAVSVARETFVLRRPLRRTRERVPLYAQAAQQMDYAVRNTRVLARRAMSAIRRAGPAPPELAEALELLADAVHELGGQLEDPEREAQTRRLALEAAVKASTLIERSPGLTVMVIVGQVRSTAIDLLRGSGLSAEEARRALDAAVQRAGVTG